MKPSTKKFSHEHYSENDSAALMLIYWLRLKGYEAIRNPDRYGIDVLSNWDSPDTGVEVEVKHNWHGPEFPFKTIHYAARKFKFLEGNQLVRFVTFNHERSHILVVDGKEFKKIVTKSTKYTDDESFYEIPFESCKIISLEE